jgi:GT2 family glycosyltransferase
MVGFIKFSLNQTIWKILFATPRTRSVRQLRDTCRGIYDDEKKVISRSEFDENCFMYSDDIDLSYRSLY